MLYEYDLTIPANTIQSDPTELEVPLCAGTIQQVEVQIPDGVFALTHVIALRGTHQVWPSNLDANIKGNDTLIRWSEDYDLDEAPFSLILRGWNDDDTFPHTITWRFAIRELEKTRQAREAVSILSRLRQTFLGRA